MVYYGRGGYTFSDVYEMPVHLRKFYLNELRDAIEREKKNIKQPMSSNKGKVPKAVMDNIPK